MSGEVVLVSEFARRITAQWHLSREAVLEIGRILVEAKEALPHGEFGAMIKGQLPFGERYAQNLMAVARDERLSDPNHGPHLPTSARTLYALTRLDDESFETLIADGTIKPTMERRDVETVVKKQHRAAREADLGIRQATSLTAPWLRHNAADALRVGKAGEHLVCADLLMRGYNVSLASQGSAYDLVVEADGVLWRVQVKSSQSTRNINATGKNERLAYSFRVRDQRENRTPSDIVACVALDIPAIAYFSGLDCPATIQLDLDRSGHDNNYVRMFDRPVAEWPFEEALSKARTAGSYVELCKVFPPFPRRRYGVVLADPPWRFEPYSSNGMDRAADNHYPTVDINLLMAIGPFVPAADDCVFFLWATAPMLKQALELMGAWGFNYRSQIVWKKDKIGTGYWFRNCHEFLLIGVRGNVPAPAPGTQWASVVEAPVGPHSAKPEIFHQLVEEYFPTLPKIELNRRGPARDGWSAWGLEADVPHETLEAAE